ncbi:MAG: DNA repair protein RecO [Bacillota bacterium]
MKYLQTRALVLSSRPFGETDRLLTLLAWDEGKIYAKAPGARRVKSKLAATVELFTCGSFLLYKGRTLFTVSQAQVETSFRELLVHVEDYARGLYFAELVERLLPEGEPNPAVFQLLVNAWSMLREGKGDRELLTRFFELRFLLLLGFRPHCDGCIFCGDRNGPFYWNTAAGGIFCESCRPAQQPGISLSRGTYALLKNLQRVSERELATLRVQQAQQKELADFTGRFLQYWTEPGPLKSLSFMAELRGRQSPGE